MKKVTLYSSSSRPRPKGRPPTVIEPHGRTASPPDTPNQPQDQPPARAEIRHPIPARFAFFRRYERLLLVVTGALFALLLVSLHEAIRPAVRQITQRDIDAAVLHTLETQPLPSVAARAYEAIRPSVVRVRGFGQHGKDEGEDVETGVGSGVVIVEKGVILTNLHVVVGAKRVKVVFADGLESDASIVGLQPEHDLAVLQAATVPDDLVPATLRSTADLAPGDTVIAVGFPFGIGPSVSAGVVSGLRREFQSPQGERLLTNLIQFDAAANPGSSGGPLVTPDGEVVGIVTAILNPTQQRVFVGIGFAVPIENAASAVGIHPF
ncbi:MAG: peptidase S1 [Zetaproteobacteria bacterium]|nr:MAG: peptidase S1 [Zetaproteobacteria bacterium]